MIFTLALTILAHLFSPATMTASERMDVCEDAKPGSVCVWFDDIAGYDTPQWIMTDTEGTFTYVTGLCENTPAPCLLDDHDGYRLISII